MKSYIKIVKAMFSGNKRVLAEAFSVMVILLALEMTIPVCVNKMINGLAVENGIVTFLGGIFLFACAYGIVCFLSALNTKLYIRIGNQLLWNMREQIYKVLWYSGYMENVQKKKDKFKFVLSNQAYTAFAIAVIYSIGGFTNLLSMIAFLVIVFLYSVPVGMTLIICIFVTLVVSFFTGKKILEGYETCNVMQEKDTSQIYETVDMVEVTRSNGLEDYYLKKNKMIHDNFLHLLETAESRSAFCETVESSLHLLLEVSQRVQRQLQVIIKNIPVFDNVVELMEIPLESGRKLEKVENITFENVSFQIEERSIFKNLNFSVQEGQKPTGGTIYINGISVEAYDCKTFYKEICYISQEEMLLNESVEDYLRYAAHADLKADNIEQMRRKVKLRPEIKNIEENGATLSGGEKKKLLMLKWLLNPSTSFVILDEIDAGLDDETKVVLKELEKELLKDRKKIVMKISHIDEDMDGYDQIIRL